MLKELKFIPVTETSKPFAAAAETCEFDKIGYIEDEYFMSGTANLYKEDALHNVSPVYEGAPYTTRLIIRRPADVSKFSGNVVIEILNASANIDIDRMWVNSWPFFTRNGDIFVGITSKGHVVDALKAFDPERYDPINWDNPRPDHPAPTYQSPFLYLHQYELGLFWDMLVDLAKLLRRYDSVNPLSSYGKRWLYLTGWSQSTGYVNRIVRSFAYRPENCADGPLFDGYLNGGGGDGLAPIDNYQEFIINRPGYTPAGVMGAKEPFMAVNTETENRTSFWYGDFDEPDFKFRTWQISGSSHNSKYNLIDYYGQEGLDALEKLGIYNAYYGVDGDPMDSPHELIFSAAFKALYAWVRDDIPAPHAPKIETYMKEEPSDPRSGSFVWNRTDAFGNCLGGIRTPAINYPTAKYFHCSTNAEGKVNPSFGKVNPLPISLLKELYGTLDNYRTLVDADYDRLAAQGFVLKEDKPAFMAQILADAERRGLK